MRAAVRAKTDPATDGAVVTKAVLRAAGRLGVSNRVLSRILGLSEASVSRMGSGTFVLAPGDKAFELGMMFVRLKPIDAREQSLGAAEALGIGQAALRGIERQDFVDLDEPVA